MKQIIEISEMFDAYDVDHSGTLDSDETISLISAMGHPVDELRAQEIMLHLDLDNDGAVSRDEFIAWSKYCDARHTHRYWTFVLRISLYIIFAMPLNHHIALFCFIWAVTGAENIIKQVEGETPVSDEDVVLGLFKLFDKDGSGKPPYLSQRFKYS